MHLFKSVLGLQMPVSAEQNGKLQMASQVGSDRSFPEIIDAAMQTKDMDNQHLLGLISERLKR